MAKFCANCGADLTATNGVCPNCKQNSSFSVNGKVNRKALKEAAKDKLRGNLWNIWKPILIIYLITFALSFVLGLFIDAETTLYSWVELALNLVLVPLSAGLILYMLKLVRGESFNTSDLFNFYDKRMWTIVLINLAVGVFTLLWSLLLVIPGIIAALGYSMALYIYVDGTKTDAMECIRESKRIMMGHKWEFVVFGLSFFGWLLLVAFTFGIAAIYVMPYMTVAETMYYDELKKLGNN